MAAFPYFKKAISPNNAISIWFDQHDPALKAYHQFQNDFGNDRIITVAFKEDKGILQPEVLKKIQLFSTRLSQVVGVKEVSSVITAKDFRRVKENDAIKIRLAGYFDDSIYFILTPKVQNELLSSPLIVSRFINKAGNVAMLIVRLDSLKLVESRMKVIIPAIEATAAVYPGIENIHIGGSDVMNYGLNKLSQHDFGLFTVLGFVLMFVITAIFYRRLLYLLLVSVVCVTSIMVSLSIHGIMGFRINIFTVISPPLIITLGVIGILHIINEYENLLVQKGNSDTHAIAREALGNIFKPALYATLTTVIGFASLFTSPTSALKEFGLLSSIGVLLLFLFSLVFASIILPLQKKIGEVKKQDTGYWLVIFSEHILNHSVRYATLSIALVLISMIGMRYINNDMNAMGYFPKNNQVVKDHEFMLKNWGDYFPVDMVLEAHDTAGFKNVKLIQALLNFDREVAANPAIKNSFDFTKVMDRYTQVTFKKELKEMINDPFVSSRYIDRFMEQLKEKSAGLVTADLLKARITFTGPLLSIRELEKNILVIENVAKKHFNGMATLTVSGYPSLYIKVMNYAFESMKSSLYSSFVLILLSMILMLGSIRTAIVALVPNVFPVIFLLGFLGFSGINLDLATCTVTAIVMGIAIDDTIYFLHKYRRARKSGMSTLESIQHTHHSVGRVILVSSLVMLAGFSIMLLASLKTVIYFGLLAMVSVVAAILGDLVVLPLLLKYVDHKKKK